MAEWSLVVAGREAEIKKRGQCSIPHWPGLLSRTCLAVCANIKIHKAKTIGRLLSQTSGTKPRRQWPGLWQVSTRRTPASASGRPMPSLPLLWVSQSPCLQRRVCDVVASKCRSRPRVSPLTVPRQFHGCLQTSSAKLRLCAIMFPFSGAPLWSVAPVVSNPFGAAHTHARTRTRWATSRTSRCHQPNLRKG